MRVRTRGPDSKDVETTVTTTDSRTGVTTRWGTYLWSIRTFGETISDEPRKRYLTLPDGRRVLGYKPVTHTRAHVSCPTGNSSWMTGPSTTASTNGTVIFLFECADTSVYGGLWNRVGSAVSEAGNHFYDHWLSCKPSLSTRANLAVSLYELGDIKRMFEVIPKRHLFRKVGGKRIALPDWRTVLKYANDQHLNYNFGWKPFIGDVKNIFRGLTSLDARLAKFLREEGKNISRRWKTTQDVSYEDTYAWSIYRSRARSDFSVTDASTFMFSYDLPEYGQRELRARALLDTLGLKASVANVWRVLPWSFVVDWFFNVSNVLDASASDWLQPWINTIQGCHSVRVVGSVEHTLENVAYGGSMPVGSLKLSSYTRTPGFPNVSGSTDPLNADKIRLLASLVAGRIL